MKKFLTAFISFITLLLSCSCSFAYDRQEQRSYFSGIVLFEEFHNGLVVDIASIGLCTIPKAEKIYYLDDDTEIQKGDLIRIRFNEEKSKIAVAESYPAQFVKTADSISVEAKNLILERTEQGFLFSQPTDKTSEGATVGELYYFIETGGYNGQAYQKLFCSAEIVTITESTTKMKLQFTEEDLLAEFLWNYPTLDQSTFWKF
jgi:hypothetical protein